MEKQLRIVSHTVNPCKHLIDENDTRLDTRVVPDNVTAERFLLTEENKNVYRAIFALTPEDTITVSYVQDDELRDTIQPQYVAQMDSNSGTKKPFSDYVMGLLPA